MAILADVHFRGIHLKKAYVKIRKTWGGADATCGILAVAVNKENADKGIYLYEFSVGPIATTTAYKSLYELASLKFTEENIEHTHDHEVNIIETKVEVPSLSDDPVKQKKTRKKKNATLSTNTQSDKNG